MQAMNGATMFSTKRVNSERPIRYVTAASFIEKLNEEMHSLFRLFLLLTGDADEAEQCFVGALEDRLRGIDVFMD
jgi:hypothetical protein